MYQVMLPGKNQILTLKHFYKLKARCTFWSTVGANGLAYTLITLRMQHNTVEGSGVSRILFRRGRGGSLRHAPPPTPSRTPGKGEKVRIHTCINAAKYFLYIETIIENFRRASVVCFCSTIFPVHYPHFTTFSFLMSLCIYFALN